MAASRRLARYFTEGFVGLKTPAGLSFQIHACTIQLVSAVKRPPRPALRLGQLDRRTVVGQHTDVVVFVPAGEGLWKRRRRRLSIGSAGGHHEIAHPHESQARRRRVLLIQQDGRLVDRECRAAPCRT